MACRRQPPHRAEPQFRCSAPSSPRRRKQFEILSKIVSSNLEIYSQNQSISLKEEEKQLNVIDKLSNSKELLNKYQDLFTDYNKLQSEINQIKNGKSLSDSELDYLNFQIDELESQTGLDIHLV